ncbi:unnamed protein product, partial [Polarella glacialis]
YSTLVPAGSDSVQSQGFPMDSYTTSYQPRVSAVNLLEAPSEQSGLIQSIKWYVYCFSFLPVVICVSFVFLAKGSEELDILEFHKGIETPHPRVFLLSTVILLLLTAFFCSVFQVEMDINHKFWESLCGMRDFLLSLRETKAKSVGLAERPKIDACPGSSLWGTVSHMDKTSTLIPDNINNANALVAYYLGYANLDYHGCRPDKQEPERKSYWDTIRSYVLWWLSCCDRQRRNLLLPYWEAPIAKGKLPTHIKEVEAKLKHVHFGHIVGLEQEVSDTGSYRGRDVDYVIAHIIARKIKVQEHH